jgi:hypothetical protein
MATEKEIDRHVLQTVQVEKGYRTLGETSGKTKKEMGR